jgi:hypothetical protein
MSFFPMGWVDRRGKTPRREPVRSDPVAAVEKKCPLHDVREFTVPQFGREGRSVVG